VTPADAELIARTLAFDDRAAFGELVLRYQSAVRYFLRHLTRGDHALADDLAQETFLRAYRGLGRFRHESTVSTWLLGIAHNQWRNARRRRAHEKTAVTVNAELRIESDAVNSDLRHDLALALRTLSADEQLAVHHCYQQGLSHRDIATLLDWPLGTVKTHLARSKDKLRPFLAAWNPQT
jgi:RNA polymerase sigma-70 factor (ECF subfamily)